MGPLAGTTGSAGPTSGSLASEPPPASVTFVPPSPSSSPAASGVAPGGGGAGPSVPAPPAASATANEAKRRAVLVRIPKDAPRTRRANVARGFGAADLAEFRLLRRSARDLVPAEVAGNTKYLRRAGPRWIAAGSACECPEPPHSVRSRRATAATES